LKVRLVLALVVALLVLPLVPGPAAVAAGPAQFRAYWVDAFGDELWTPAKIDKLVQESKAANMNALVVQVGRRGDCFCNRASMPRTQQAGVLPAPYDPLDTLIQKAHAAGIEVHAWIITTALWNSNTAPVDPRHAFNTNGPSKSGTYDYWLGVRYDGAVRESTSSAANWFFDPGHPDAAQYIVDMYTSVARNYDIDGLNFDRVRYPDLSPAPWNLTNAWGYNPVAVARFNSATGRTGRPLPDDAQWAQWRRDQITNIVRKVYLETYAVKPHVRISADTITYGHGPQNAVYGTWENSRPYRETLQDWRAWMEEGILDLNIPMNYKREHCTATDQTANGCFGFNQQLMYEEWNEFTFDHQYGRQAAIGPAIYLNYIAGSVAQARKALAPSRAGNSGIGWVGYSYGTPDCYAPRAVRCRPGETQRSADVSRAELTRALTQPSEYDAVTPPVFADPAAVPGMPWKDAPTRGHARGTVQSKGGRALDQVRVDIYNAETEALVTSRTTDGQGWFGVVDLVPAKYKAVVDQAVVYGHNVTFFTVSAGTLSTVVIEARLISDRPNRQRGPDVEVVEPQEIDEQPNGER